jgi:predicted Zn-dependent protease
MVVATRGLLLALCVAGTATALTAYRSERRADEVTHLARQTIPLKRSDPARFEELRRRALALVDGARRLNPDTRIDIQIGLLLEPDKQRAESVLENAVQREPENLSLWLVLSQKQAADGNTAAARSSYAHARTLDPRLPRPR